MYVVVPGTYKFSDQVLYFPDPYAKNVLQVIILYVLFGLDT